MENSLVYDEAIIEGRKRSSASTTRLSPPRYRSAALFVNHSRWMHEDSDSDGVAGGWGVCAWSGHRAGAGGVRGGFHPPADSPFTESGQLHAGAKIEGTHLDFGYVSLWDLLPYALRVNRFKGSSCCA